MDDDIVMLKRGDPCPLCGQPIQTDDKDALYAQRIRPQALPKYRLAYREEGWRS